MPHRMNGYIGSEDNWIVFLVKERLIDLCNDDQCINMFCPSVCGFYENL